MWVSIRPPDLKDGFEHSDYNARQRAADVIMAHGKRKKLLTLPPTLNASIALFRSVFPAICLNERRRSGFQKKFRESGERGRRYQW